MMRSTQETRRWAFYAIGAQMRSQDIGELHGPVLWLEPVEPVTERLNAVQDRLFTPVQTVPGQLMF